MSDTRELLRPMIVSGIWLVLWAGITAAMTHELATSWPYENLPSQLVLAISVPGILFRAGDILYMQRFDAQLARWRRAAARVAAFAVGLAAMAFVWQPLDQISMDRFEQAMAPIVLQIHARPSAPCPPDTGYVVDKALADYLAESNPVRRPAELHYDAGRFVFSFMGRSIDIDGSTIYYDSTTRKWQKFHNDLQVRSKEFNALVNNLSVCRVSLQ